ncbi:hypothetical protein B0J11DRAFT_501752 [Dendryphion nanum]|uniref:Uncharacterized protein n=1 Tax=Dendryphion nanum TaxID=256645 RepID=A0A9P9E962_9PLEO|nr:hypothetical protein B0J11DRAFT_501752 [Dendryphion nanum]
MALTDADKRLIAELIKISKKGSTCNFSDKAGIEVYFQQEVTTTMRGGYHGRTPGPSDHRQHERFDANQNTGIAPKTPETKIPRLIGKPVKPEPLLDNIVISNYVKIKNVPDRLYIYSMTFNRPSSYGSGEHQLGFLELNKQRDIMSAFKMMIDKNHLKTDEISWATDYKSLWTASILVAFTNNLSRDMTLDPFTWTQPGGATFSDLHIKLSS